VQAAGLWHNAGLLVAAPPASVVDWPCGNMLAAVLVLEYAAPQLSTTVPVDIAVVQVY